ncbi:type II CAAX prenyl endopeptidase Rce1 family protein [Halobacteriaceae archaeon GCM10025711]
MGEEIVFRLFLIPLVVWLLSVKLLHGRHRTLAFWTAAGLSAVAFTVAHLPSVLFLLGTRSIGAVPPVLLGELFVLNGLLSLVAAVLFRRSGFLAAVGVHFWTDVVWHVVYGVL